MKEAGQTLAPKVFVSYSWDSPAHTAWVLRLATRLRSNGVDVKLDVWDTRLGSDLAYFMELSAADDYRVLAIVTPRYFEKANNLEGGVGYEKYVITPTLMKDLGGHRVVPVLRDNPDMQLPNFLGTAKYLDFCDDSLYEDRYYELLQDLFGIQPTPKPPLGKNPFLQVTDEDVALYLKHDPARFVMPALAGETSFDYATNSGIFVIGAGERAFSLKFSEAGHGAIYIYNDPSDIKTVALAPNVNSVAEIGDASTYDASSRSWTINVGDAAILRNQNNYWAAVFVDEVLTRHSSSDGNSRIRLRYHIPPVPSPSFMAVTEN